MKNDTPSVPIVLLLAAIVGFVDAAGYLLLGNLFGAHITGNEQIVERLLPEIRDGVEIVGLEPSCVDVFRDELVNMLPHDEDAKRLSKQTYSFVEFLTERLDGEPLRLDARAVVQGHCHHRAAEKTMKHDGELLDRLGLDYEVLDTGAAGWRGRSATRPASTTTCR